MFFSSTLLGDEKKSKDLDFLRSQSYHLNWQKHKEQIEAAWMLKLN